MPILGVEKESKITKAEVEKSFNETKTGTARGVDSITAEMLKKEAITVVEWLVRLCNICFYLLMCPVEWVLVRIVPLCKGKVNVHKCGNYIGIRLLYCMWLGH